MHSLHLSDSILPLRGVFTITGKDRDGNVVFQDEERNMIVSGAKRAICMLLSDANADLKVIKQIGFGLSPTTPTPNDSALTGAYVKLIDSYTYPDTNKVSFRWQLGYDEANGKNIVEFGLICADNTLFARKVRGGIAKESDLMLEGEWTLIF